MTIKGFFFLFVLVTLSILSSAQTPEISALKKSYLEHPHDTTRVVLLQKYVTYYTAANQDSMLYYAAELSELAAAIGHPKGVMTATFAYALSQYRVGNYDSSLYYFSENLKAARLLGDPREISKGLGNIGVIHFNQARYEVALDYYLQSYQIAENSDQSIPVASTLNNIGLIYQQLKNYKRALEFHHQALARKRLDGNINGMIASYTNIAAVYNDLGQIDSALVSNQRGLDLTRQVSNPLGLANLQQNRGSIYLNDKQYDSAEWYFEKARIYFEAKDTKLELGEALTGLGNVYYEAKKYLKAVEMYNSAQGLFRAMEAREELSNCLYELAKSQKALGRNSEAYDNLMESKALGDTLFSKRSIDALSEMQTKYESEKKDKEIVLQKVQLEAQTVELTRQQFIRNAAIGAVILITLIAGLIFWNFRIKTRSNREISQKNELLNRALTEREALLKEIHHRVKNNLQIIASLLYLQSDESENLDAKRLLEEGQGRVRSMALIHQKLYENDDLKHIPFDEYLDELISEIKLSFGDMAKDVALEVEAKNIFFDVDTAVPLGLIINELSTNAFKYAYTQRMGGGVFKVVLQHEEGTYHLTVSDNGSGIPDELMHATQSASLGLKLTRMLSDQLEGDYRFSNSNGTTFELKFAV